MIPEEVVQEVLARADIVQVIGDYVTLKRASAQSLKGLCPFHGEKSPSFHVTPSKGLYYCFGCGAGGSVIDFLRQIEGLSFPEAIERLGGRFGVEVVHSNADRGEVRKRRELKARLLEVNEIAERFFRAQLASGGHAAVQSYVSKRGLGPQVVEVFRLGFAPDAWDALESELRRAHADLDAAEQAGLLVARERGRGHYDRFRNRLIFPVVDASGQVIAFGGRTLDAEVGAKYINSPESIIYKKGHNLYGLHAAREAMRREGRAILVEGNIDVIKMYQAGFEATVAPMGTALTPEQATLLKRHVERVVLLFDGDGAGLKAAMRAIKPLQSAEIEAHVALLPSGEDPDSFVGVHGEAGMSEILADARPLGEWAVEQVCESVLEQPIELRAGALAELSELLRMFDSPVVQRHYLAESARKLGYQPGELSQLLDIGEVSGAGTKNPSQTLTSVRGTGIGHQPLDAIEFELLKLLLDSRDRLGDFVESDGLLLIQDTRVARLLEMVWEASVAAQGPESAAETAASQGDELNSVSGASEQQQQTSEGATAVAERAIASSLHAVIEQLEDESLRRLAFEAIVAPRDYAEVHGEDWFRGAIAALTDRWVKREKIRIGNELEEAYRVGDQGRIAAINERIAQIHRLETQARKDRKVNWDAHVE